MPNQPSPSLAGIAGPPNRPAVGAARCVIAAVVLALLLAACARIDGEQARVCESIVPAVEISAPLIRLVSTRPLAPAGGARVRVDYAVPDASGHDRKSFLICRFGTSNLSSDRLRVTGLAGPDGPWSEVELLLLNRFWLGEPGVVLEGRTRLVATEQPRRDLTVAALVAAFAGLVLLIAAVIAHHYGQLARLRRLPRRLIRAVFPSQDPPVPPARGGSHPEDPPQ